MLHPYLLTYYDIESVHKNVLGPLELIKRLPKVFKYFEETIQKLNNGVNQEDKSVH